VAGEKVQRLTASSPPPSGRAGKTRIADELIHPSHKVTGVLGCGGCAGVSL